MKVKSIYGVVVKFADGGMVMDNFMGKCNALEKSKEIINHILENKREGVKVFLSELEYDTHRNTIISSELVNSQSELLFCN